MSWLCQSADTAVIKLNVRPYQHGDRQDVMSLWELVFPDDPPWNQPGSVIDAKLKVQPDLFLVAEADGRVIATTLAGFDGVRGWLHHVACHPDFQRNGVAEQLIQTAETGLQKLGCRKVNLQVRNDNTAVIGFYEKLGFSTEDRISLGKRLPD